MEKESRRLVFTLTTWILIFLFALLYIDVSWRITLLLEPHFHDVSARKIIFSGKVYGNITVVYDDDSLHFLLTKLVKGNDRIKLEETGFSCESQIFSKHCVINRVMHVDTTTMTVMVPSNNPVVETIIRPYARQEDEILLQKVSPVKIITGNSTPASSCQYEHRIPAVVFSTSGFVGNVFHEMNEIIIPLFITTKLFKSRVQLIAEDYNPLFMKKYSMALKFLTSSEIINPKSNGSVHCFPGGVIGLKFHGHLAVNSGDIPTGFSTGDLRHFLRESYNLKYTHITQLKRPRLLLLSRRSTRRILNEDEIIAMMQELGFEVIVISRAKTISNLNIFSRIINSCSVFVGAHGAGLTNELFLPDGAVMVQVDLIGLNWAAATYYGDPARAMGLHYLRYQIRPQESSLWKVFGSENSTVFTDPVGSFPAEVGKEIYLNGQNVRIDVHRFRETMVEAMSLVRGDSTP